MVLFLHGFPEYWWAWHDLLPARRRRRLPGRRGRPARLRRQRQATPGVRRLHPRRRRRRTDPRARRAVGDPGRRRLGGMIGWTAAAFHPTLVRRLVVLGAPHPLRLRAAHLRRPARPVRRRHAGAEVPAPPLRARADPRRRAAGRRVPAPRGAARVGGRHRDFATYARALPRGDADPAGGVLRAGGLPLGVPLGAAAARLPVRAADAAAAGRRRPCNCTARWTPRPAPHRAGLRPVRHRPVRVAAARRRRPLPARGGAGRGASARSCAGRSPDPTRRRSDPDSRRSATSAAGAQPW